MRLWQSCKQVLNAVEAFRLYRAERALLKAARSGKSKKLRRLLNRYGSRIINATENYQGRTALMLAAWQGFAEHAYGKRVHSHFTECVDILLKAGADPTLRDVDGRTALTMAALAGNPHVLKLLLKDKTTLHMKDVNMCTPVMNCVNMQGITKTRLQCLYLLLDAGADYLTDKTFTFKTAYDLAERHEEKTAKKLMDEWPNIQRKRVEKIAKQAAQQQTLRESEIACLHTGIENPLVVHQRKLPLQTPQKSYKGLK